MSNSVEEFKSLLWLAPFMRGHLFELKEVRQHMAMIAGGDPDAYRARARKMLQASKALGQVRRDRGPYYVFCEPYVWKEQATCLTEYRQARVTHP